MRYLRTLHLAENILSSVLPPALGTLEELEDLVLTRNYFVGALPAPSSKGGLMRLRRLECGDNRFQGGLPPTLRLLIGLDRLDVSGNRLTGPLPPGYGELQSLRILMLNHNALDGPLPEQWAGLLRLRVLEATGNRLTGVVPEMWGRGMHALTRLALDDNRIEGRLPASLFMLPKVQVLALHGNQLTGTLPESISLANASLQVFDVGGNFLSGALPAALTGLPKLTRLDLSMNRLSGFLPDYLVVDTLLLDLAGRQQLLLAGNDFACPLPPWAPHGTSCSTRNCPLNHVSDGRVCVPCRPGYYRDAHGGLCSRCPTSFMAADDADVGVVTDRACAVMTQALPRAASPGNAADTRGDGIGGRGHLSGLSTRSDDSSTSLAVGVAGAAIKCMPCRQAARLQLAVVAEEDADAMRALVSDSDRSGGPDTRENEASSEFQVYGLEGVGTDFGVLRWNGSSAYPDGAKYTGETRDGAPHGRGALVTKFGLYVGEFVRGKREGKGEFTSVAGDSYSGEWGDFGAHFSGTGTNWGGVLNGRGVARYRANARVALRALATGLLTPAQVGSAGGTYEGEWKDGEWHGMGAFSAANGDVYLGDFVRGKFHGRGLLHLHDGGYYKGGWQLGKKAGNGTMYYANGDLYEGGWVEDLRHGWGAMWYWDGKLYEGYWEMGLKQGWGRETIERTGQVFEGQFRANLKHGHGTLHYGNGDAYHGTFVDGMRHGDGVMHYADALFKDVGYQIRAGFMFDEPRINRRMTKVDDTTNSFLPTKIDGDPDDALQYWGQVNTNYLVGEGYSGGGR